MSTDCRSSWRETSDAAQRERGAVERVADARTRRARAPAATRMSPSTSSAPPAGRDREAEHREQQQLPEPEQAEPDHLPRQQVRGLERGEQQLDDARGLLLHHARGHEVADPDQLAVEQQHGEEGEAAAVLAARRRARGASPAAAAATSARRASRSPTPGLAQRVGAADAAAFAACRMLDELVVGLVLRADRRRAVSAASTSRDAAPALDGHVGVERVAAAHRGLGDRPGAGSRDRDRVGVRPPKPSRFGSSDDEQR